MKSPVFAILTAIILFTVISCKKDNSGSSPGTPSIQDTWTFVSLHVNTLATDQSTDGGIFSKDLTTSSYTSTDNGGSVVFSANSMTGTGITYKITATAYTSEFEDNVLLDTFSFPFDFTYPPTNSTAAYKQVGQDSLTYTGQSLFSIQNGSVTSVPTGAKFNIVNDTMTLTSNFVKDSSFDGGGFTVYLHEEGTAITTLQKQ